MVLIRSELWDGEFAWFLGLASKKPEVVGEETEVLFVLCQVASGATVCACVVHVHTHITLQHVQTIFPTYINSAKAHQ